MLSGLAGAALGVDQHGDADEEDAEDHEDLQQLEGEAGRPVHQDQSETDQGSADADELDLLVVDDHADRERHSADDDQRPAEQVAQHASEPVGNQQRPDADGNVHGDGATTQGPRSRFGVQCSSHLGS